MLPSVNTEIDLAPWVQKQEIVYSSKARCPVTIDKVMDLRGMMGELNGNNSFKTQMRPCLICNIVGVYDNFNLFAIKSQAYGSLYILLQNIYSHD